MNLRGTIATISTIPGVESVETVDIVPVCAVIECPRVLSKSSYDNLQESWDDAFKGKPPFPLLILQDGMTINFITRQKAEDIARLNEPGPAKVDG